MSENLNTDPNSRRRSVAGANANIPTVDPTIDQITFPTLTAPRTLFLANPDAVATARKIQRGWKLELIIATGPTAGSTLTVSCPAVTDGTGVHAAKNINGAATFVIATDYAIQRIAWDPEAGEFVAEIR